MLLFSLAERDHHDLHKRAESYHTDPKSYLDQVIEHWIYKIPFLIDESVETSEKDLRLTVAKRVTQVRVVALSRGENMIL